VCVRLNQYLARPRYGERRRLSSRCLSTVDFGISFDSAALARAHVHALVYVRAHVIKSTDRMPTRLDFTQLCGLVLLGPDVRPPTIRRGPAATRFRHAPVPVRIETLTELSGIVTKRLFVFRVAWRSACQTCEQKRTVIITTRSRHHRLQHARVFL